MPDEHSTVEHCARCNVSGRELRRHVTEAKPPAMILSEERICRACFDRVRDDRMAKLKARAEIAKPIDPTAPLEGDEVPF